MNRLALAALAALSLTYTACAQEPTSAKSKPAPELVGSLWVNGAPVKLADLKGKVVILGVWTFECINCQRTIPYWNGWAKKYAGKDVVVVTIHTPEVDSERDPKSVEAFAKKKGLVFPILIDNDQKNWKNWTVRMWPSMVLIDKKGQTRAAWEGELDWKGSGAYKDVERAIEALRKEK